MQDQPIDLTVLDFVDKLGAIIHRTKAINSVVEWNIVFGCGSYHTIPEEVMARLCWQITENLDLLHKTVNELHNMTRTPYGVRAMPGVHQPGPEALTTALA